MSTYKGFTTVQLRKPKRSKFDLSHEKRVSTRMGRLTPIFISETMPNDTFRCNSEVMLRLAPLIAPIMHRVNVFVHYFFIPNRLLWEDWELFITNGRLGTETPPVPPNTSIQAVLDLALNYLDTGSLADYLGVGSIGDADEDYADTRIDLMPFNAIYKVWYDYYRDRNFIEDDTLLPMASGLENTAFNLNKLFRLSNRDWQKDYFTSALPWTQRGSEVLMPIIGAGTVNYLEQTIAEDGSGNPINITKTLQTTTGSSPVGEVWGDAGITPIQVRNIESVNIENSDVSINDLRRAVQLQTWLERNALAGSRYNESIMAHFARKTSDARLQRAEYLGGGKVTVKISEIVTTAFSQDDTDTTVPPANMAGHGLSFGNTNRFTYNCEEHGFVVGLMSVMPNSAYMQGSHRMFFGRNTFLDYPWPSFAHLGEQEVKDYEIFQAATTTTPVRSSQPAFGYQSRYSDWKYIPSSSHGDFKTSLDFWHLTRKFSLTPVLGAAFNNFEDTLQDRVFAVSGVDTLWAYIYNNCSVIRSLPYFGTPQL